MTTPTVNILISLHRGYGLGDAVMMSAVLRHVRKYRPNWYTVFRAECGREQVGAGIAHQVCTYEEGTPALDYDGEVLITLFDEWRGWHDRPNTHVSACLHRHFGMGWDRECGRYQISIGEDASEAALGLLRAATRGHRDPSDFIAVHYQGDTARDKKNLTHAQAAAICRTVERHGGTPVLIDWRDQSPLPDTLTVSTVGRFGFSQAFGCSAEMNAAVIARCRAFVGIDSGPAKCASATDTPALVVWCGHHPAQFHDPAPNTTHLISSRSIPPVSNDPAAMNWFRENYNVAHYDDSPVEQVDLWLREVLS